MARMLVLALDTATPVSALALAGPGFEGETRLPPGRHSSEVILPSLAALLERAGARLADISRIAVVAGPGSFTGIRVGLATAWGLSRSLRAPLETVGSLEALAETARGEGAGVVSAWLPAERGDVYAATFDLSDPRARLEGEEILIPQNAAASLPGRIVPPRDSGDSPALAAARAVRRAPGETAHLPRARYGRPSAAEEPRGLGRS
jgi:tRNA threonylcarbamoyladenosine biosynthesis protein TsaB